jgi:aflatoxin B1 aldehyde reductase
MAPQLVFGTASFGMDLTEFQDAESVKNLLQTIRGLGINHLDSGARYPPLRRGRAEELIGEAIELSGSFIVDTKVYTDTQTDGSGDLSRQAIQKSVNGSLHRLRRPEGVSIALIRQNDVGFFLFLCPERSTLGQRALRASRRSCHTARRAD